MAQIRELNENQSGDLLVKEKSFRKLLDEFKASMKRAFHREDESTGFAVPGEYHPPF